MSKFLSAMTAAKDRNQAVLDSVAAEIKASLVPVASVVPARHGRPAGKRSNLESVQVTAYIQSETHYATKLALLINSRKGGPKRDFSDLVQQLLTEWLALQQV